jgi:membrane protease YdiL (CAAX protease family)
MTGAGVATAVAIVGIGAVTTAWYLVRARAFSLWLTMGVTFAVLGVLSVATQRVRWATEVGTTPAIAVGLGSGVVLYVLTVAFFRVARRWGALRRQTESLYEHREGISRPLTLGVGSFLVSPGEELFWRGLVQDGTAFPAGSIRGAVLAWGLYVAANVSSGSLPIVLAAAVGGAAWGTLAWWAGGVAASVVCHAAWTALMIVRPPT